MSNVQQLFDLSGKRALVTGSDRGIGQAIVLALAAAGADVIVHSADDAERTEATAQQAREFGVNAATAVLDFLQDDAATLLQQQATDGLEGIDILVLNASAQINGFWLDHPRENFDKQITVNMRASLEILQCFVPPMAERGWGRVLALGSVQQVKPNRKTLIYAATKSAQYNMMQNLAKQYGSQGVTFNNLSPGFTATERNIAAQQDETYMQEIVGSIPLRRIGTPQDCAAVALMLCSDAGAYITGADIPVDGGMHLS